MMILNELKARREEKRSLLLLLRPTFLFEIIYLYTIYLIISYGK